MDRTEVLTKLLGVGIIFSQKNLKISVLNNKNGRGGV